MHQQRDLPGPLVRGGAQPAADERGPGRGTGVGGRPDEDEGGDPFRRAHGGLGDDLAARRVPDQDDPAVVGEVGQEEICQRDRRRIRAARRAAAERREQDNGAGGAGEPT